jgi:hypothetical protein
MTEPPPSDRELELDVRLAGYGRLVCAKLSELDALEKPVCRLLGVVGAVLKVLSELCMP